MILKNFFEFDPFYWCKHMFFLFWNSILGYISYILEISIYSSLFLAAIPWFLSRPYICMLLAPSLALSCQVKPIITFHFPGHGDWFLDGLLTHLEPVIHNEHLLSFLRQRLTVRWGPLKIWNQQGWSLEAVRENMTLITSSSPTWKCFNLDLFLTPG